MPTVRKWYYLPTVALDYFMSAWKPVGALLRDCYRSYVSDDLSGPRDQIVSYWKIYGGWGAVGKSPALWVSFLITAVCYPFWKMGTWPDTTLSIVPNLLGFSLGAMAVGSSFPTSSLFRLFAEPGRRDLTIWIWPRSLYILSLFRQLP